MVQAKAEDGYLRHYPFRERASLAEIRRSATLTQYRNMR